MQLERLPQYQRNARRFTTIVAVIGKYGLAGWLGSSEIGFLKRWFTDGDGHELLGRPLGERLRLALVELGPTFIKIGQLLSTRPDLVGPVIAGELEHLQAEVPADPPEVVMKTLREGLQAEPDECFAAFDPVPLASASIGQVHVAQLRDGDDVVVKIRHDGIADQMRDDLDILVSLTVLAERSSERARNMRLQTIARMSRRLLLQELDFRRERRNARMIAQRFGEDQRLFIPRMYDELSSDCVLTMQRLRGVSLRDWTGHAEDGQALARIGASIYLDMVFRDGLYHADPHPGNIFVLGGKRFGLIDFGLVGRLDTRLRGELEEAMIATADGNGEEIARRILRIVKAPQEFDAEMFRGDLDGFIGDYTTQPLKELDINRALHDLTRLLHEHRLVLPTSLALLVKMLITLDGSARLLDPDFALSEAIEPYKRDIMTRRLSPRRLLDKIRRSGRDWQELFSLLPRELADMLPRLRQGRFDLHLDHRGLPMAINRLVGGIVAAACLLSGSMMVSSEVPPMTGGVSWPGAILMAYGLFVAVRLMRAISKSGGWN